MKGVDRDATTVELGGDSFVGAFPNGQVAGRDDDAATLLPFVAANDDSRSRITI